MASQIGAISVINLNKSPARWQNILKQCRTANIIPDRIEAIDGNSLQYNDYKDSTSLFCRQMCTKSMIACAMSHLKAWKKLANSDDQYHLIMEDDVTIPKDLMCRITQIWPPETFDILFLGCTECRPSYMFQTVTTHLTSNFLNIGNKDYNDGQCKNGEPCTFKPQITLGLHAYILTKDAAIKLLQIFHKEKISYHIDFTLQKISSQGRIKIKSVWPPIVNQETKLSSSTISGNERKLESVKNDVSPILLNRILDNVYDMDNSSVAWKMSQPWAQVAQIRINSWTFLCFILGIILSRFGRKGKLLATVVGSILFLSDACFLQLNVLHTTFVLCCLIAAPSYLFVKSNIALAV